MLATEMHEYQKEEFTQSFYEFWPYGDADVNSPAPWGMPWQFGYDVELSGKTIDEMAQNFFNDFESEIREQIESESDGIDNCHCCGDYELSDDPEIAAEGLCDRCNREINEDAEIIGWRKGE